MTGTFGSLNIAKTGLQYQQVAIDVADNNIANVNTDGYVRRRAVGAELSTAAPGAMWSTDTAHGEGVTTQSVQRLSDVLMDSRVRSEHANLSSLQVQQTSLERVETAIGEPSDTGVAAAISTFASGWQDVVNSPDGSSARQAVIADGQSLTAAITTEARSIDAEMDQQRGEALEDVDDINNDAQQLAQLNHNIFLAQANGTDASDLMDQRDQMALDLANKAGAVVSVDPSNGMYNVTVGNVALVNNASAGSIAVSGIEPDGSATSTVGGVPGQISFTVTTPAGATPAGATPASATPSAQSVTGVTVGGDLGGVSILLNSTLRDLRQQLNDVAQNLATVVNAQHGAGLDQKGQPGEAFFTFVDAAGDPSTDYAGTIGVNAEIATDPSKVAAAAAPTVDADGVAVAGTASNDATNADRLAQVLTGGPLTAGSGTSTATITVTDAAGDPVTAIDVSDQYQRMITDLGSKAAAINNQTTNQQSLVNQVDDERDQTAGVSLDEETVNLMQAQRAYQASSRVLTVLDSVLDTLINHTGVTA